MKKHQRGLLSRGALRSPFFLRAIKPVKEKPIRRGMKTQILSLTAITILTLSIASCSKNEAANKARLLVSLTDDPGNYEVVNIDVQDVRINYSDDAEKGWKSLPGVKAGNYDVLRLANGRDALLADAEINTGKIKQIRLVLGANNFVQIGGKTFSLKTPGAQQSGLKLKINQEVSEGLAYKLLMDFDASRSIVRTGNDQYILKPVIRTTLEAVGGSVKGFVLPGRFATAVYALQGTDTVAGTYTVNGGYMLKSLPSGNYTLAFVPSDASYKKAERPGITVSVNNVTVVDTVRLVP